MTAIYRLVQQLRRRTPGWSTVILLAGLCASGAAVAEDPALPVSLVDDTESWVIPMNLEQDRAPEVTLTLSFNRFAGDLVDQGAHRVQGYAVDRILEPRFDGRTYTVDLSPTPPGVRPLPDGVYSAFVRIDIDARGVSEVPWSLVHPVYYEVRRGIPSRLSMLEYSERVERTVSGTDKFGEKVVELEGEVGFGLPILVGETERRIESGSGFNTDPADEQREP